MVVIYEITWVLRIVLFTWFDIRGIAIKLFFLFLEGLGLDFCFFRMVMRFSMFFITSLMFPIMTGLPLQRPANLGAIL